MKIKESEIMSFLKTILVAVYLIMGAILFVATIRYIIDFIYNKIKTKNPLYLYLDEIITIIILNVLVGIGWFWFSKFL